MQLIKTCFLGVIFGLSGCGASQQEQQEGQPLAKQYCGTCHLTPEPTLLPKAAWTNAVLPAMGALAGIYKDKTGEYKKPAGQTQPFIDSTVAHMRADIPLDAWKKIVDYYTRSAPDFLASAERSVAASPLSFTLKYPPKQAASFTNYVFFDERTKRLFQSNVSHDRLTVYDKDLNPLLEIPDCRSVAHIQVLPTRNGSESRYLFTHIGGINPKGAAPVGFVEIVTLNGNTLLTRQRIAENLYRPVQSVFGDVNGDRRPDLLVAEFGFMRGQLSLFLQTRNGTYTKTALSTLPGAEVIQSDDINRDGKVDFWVLFAQGREEIYQFINQGDGTFSQKKVLEFPSVYGSTYFQLVDFNGDGLQDILYTCGDNADLSPVLKPYHGVYIYLNTGQSYRQHLFIPVNGCYKALPTDLDGDTRNDLVVISFFADYTQQEERGLLLLMNDKKGGFTPTVVKGVSGLGRWATMTVNDLNDDGLPDILLGNMAAKPDHNTALMNKWINGPEFLLLEQKKR